MSRYFNQEIREGLIESIINAITNGISPHFVVSQLEENKATAEEVNCLIGCLNNYDNNFVKKAGWKEILKGYIMTHPECVRQIKCVACEKPTSVDKLYERNMYSLEEKRNVPVEICMECDTVIRSKRMKCGGCGTYLPKEYKFVCQLNSKCSFKPMCPNTDCNERHNKNFHKAYNERKWKPVKKYMSKKPGTIGTFPLPVGIEFEVVGNDYTANRVDIFKLNKHVGIGSDASIRNFANGTEVQTPPASGIQLEKMAFKVTEALKKGGFNVNARCGTHIHIDLYKTFGKLTDTPQFYKSLLAAYTYFEPWWMSTLPKSRTDNRYAMHLQPRYLGHLVDATYWTRKRFSKIWYQTENENDIVRYKTEKNLAQHEQPPGSHHHVTKFLWANFHSMLRGEGLEIRSLEGTVSAETVLKWIDLHTQFIIGVSKLQKPFHIMMYLNKYELSNDWKMLQKRLYEMIPMTDKTKEFVEARHEMNSKSAPNRDGNLRIREEQRVNIPQNYRDGFHVVSSRVARTARISQQPRPDPLQWVPQDDRMQLRQAPSITDRPTTAAERIRELETAMFGQSVEEIARPMTPEELERSVEAILE